MPDKPEQPNRDLNEVSKEHNGKFQHLVKYCLDLYDTSKRSDYREATIREIKEARKTYEQTEETTTYPWANASNIILPLETITIDNLEPRLVAGLVGKKPVIEITMLGQEEQDEPTKIIQDHYNSELEEVVKIEKAASDMVHDLLLEGTIYPVPEYNIDETVRRDYRFDEETGEIVVGDDNKPVTTDNVEEGMEGGNIGYVPFTNVFVPDDAEDWEKTDVIIKSSQTYAELQQAKDKHKPGYMNIGTWLIDEQGSDELTEEDQTPAQNLANVKLSKERVDLIECHVNYIYQEEDAEEEELKDFTEERLIVTIALEKQIIIRLRLLREVNFSNQHIVKRIRLYPERGRSYGRSLHGKMKSIQQGASDIFNLIINIATVCMMPWFMYGDKAGIKGDVVLFPGKGIKVDDPNAVVFPKFQIQPHQYIEFINLFITLWERLGNISDPQLGREGDKKTTATQWLGMVQESNIKHNYQSRTLRDEFLSVLRTLYDLYYQHMPFGQQYPYKGENKPFPRSQMKRRYKFRLTGSTEVANKLIERRENEDIYNLTAENPHVNPIKIAEDLIQSYKPDANLKEYILENVALLVQAYQENPELLQQVVQPYLEDKQRIAAEIEGQEKEPQGA